MNSLNSLNCDEFDDLAPELALGVLAGNERAAALAHLAGCPQCREHLDGLVRVGDSLLLLAPEAEPPIGFESRVVARLIAEGAGGPAAPQPAAEAAVAPLPSRATGQGAAAPFTEPAPWGTSHQRHRGWLPLAGIAAALILIAGVVGLLAGRGQTNHRTVAVRSALVRADGGKSTCRVVAFAGVDHAPTVLAIHLDESSEPTASYPVLVEPAKGGPELPVGAIAVRGGQGSLLATVPAGAGRIKGVVVVWPDGSPRYQATFTPV